MKRCLSMLLALGLLLMPRASFAQIADEPPALTVTCEGRQIPCQMGLLRWNGSAYDRKDVFIDLLESGAEPPYLAPGSRIQIEFAGAAPDTALLRDCLLNEDGTEKYWVNQSSEPVEFPLTQGAGGFILEPNWMSALSSNLEDYAPGATLRGFRLICNWGETQCEYGFILRTDATAAEESPFAEPLAQKARQMAVLLQRTASCEEILNLYTSSEEILSQAAFLETADYQSPLKACVIHLPSSTLKKVFQSFLPDAAADEEILRALQRKTFTAYLNRINGDQDARWLAINAILSQSEAFLLPGGLDGVAYVSLWYGDDQPAVMAAFSGERDQVVQAYATFVKAEQGVLFPSNPQAALNAIFGVFPMDPASIDAADIEVTTLEGAAIKA